MKNNYLPYHFLFSKWILLIAKFPRFCLCVKSKFANATENGDQKVFDETCKKM